MHKEPLVTWVLLEQLGSRVVLDKLDSREQLDHQDPMDPVEHQDNLDLAGDPDRLGHQDLTVSLVRMDFRVQSANQVLRVRLVRLVSLEQLVSLVLWGHPVLTANLVNPDPMVSLEHQEVKELQELLEALVHREHPEIQDKMEHLVRLGRSEIQVKMVVQDLRVLAVQLDPTVSLVSQVSQVRQVNPDLPDRMEIPVSKDSQDHKVFEGHQDPLDLSVPRVRQDPPVRWVSLVNLVQPVKKDHPVHLDNLDLKDQQDPWVRLETQVKSAHKEPLVRLDKPVNQDLTVSQVIQEIVVSRDQLDL